MMAVYLRDNVISLVRNSGCPFWKIYETETKKTAGNFVISADWENKDLGLEASCDDLRHKLSMLAAGRYLLTSFKQPGATRAGIDCVVELESINGIPNRSVISGTEQPVSETQSFFIEGIGKVTPENFESAIEKKMQAMIEKQRAADHLANLERELAELKREARAKDTAINRGLISVGTIAYPSLKSSPHFKEVFSMVGSALKGSGTLDDEPKEIAAVGATTNHEETNDENLCEIGGTKVNQDRLFTTLDKLGRNNPEVLNHLEMLAKVKENDPDTYQSGIDFLES